MVELTGLDGVKVLVMLDNVIYIDVCTGMTYVNFANHNPIVVKETLDEIRKLYEESITKQTRRSAEIVRTLDQMGDM